MASVGRNQPCPCGSGRRYKECHGSFGSSPERGPTPLPPSRQAEIALLMRDALALQQEGRLAEAIANYQAVVAEQPDNFDALHMLGVAWFQSNQLDRAEHYVERALAIRPDIIAAQSNRALIDDARRLAAREAELCRQVLPKMSALSRSNPCDSQFDKQEAFDLVIAARALDGDDVRVIERIGADPRFRTVAWQRSLTAAASDLKKISEIVQIGSGRGPESEFTLVYGIDIPAAAWIRARLPAHVGLVVNVDLPCELLDRVRELSDQGRSPVDIVYTRPELRSLSGLPGMLLDEWLAGDSPR
jgi:tetratricopeptide (TPR) repeat protein